MRPSVELLAQLLWVFPLQLQLHDALRLACELRSSKEQKNYGAVDIR